MTDLQFATTTIQAAVPVTVLHLTGRIDASNFDRMTAAAKSAFNDGARHLVLDFASADFISSAGLRGIHQIYLLFQPAEDAPIMSANVALANVPASIERAIKAIGFFEFVASYPSVEDAAAMFTP